jgi:glycolate oxidase FAD binding subunit
MTTTLNIADHLTTITGPQYVRQHEDTITVSPANTQQISSILRYANENNLSVTPIGGNTKQSWGNEIQTNPTKTNVHLDLTRLNRVLEHPWQDLTCTVQAGCTWQHLQEALKQHGQFVALDPLWPERATVGGILATNDSGALRHRYGSLRDLVIGMTLVLADGTIARSGGKVVKNVAGYDLCKLVTGSLGTLAVITEATFRLHPLPQHTQTFTISAPQAAQLAPLMASIRASHLLTEALQLRGDSYGFHLDIQLNAHPEAKQDEILAQMTQSADLLLEKAEDRVWLVREHLFADVNSFTVKATMLPTDVASLSERALSIEGHCVTQSNGIMFASFPAPGHTTAYSISSFREEVEKHKGSVVVLKYASPSWSDLLPFGKSSNALPLMQATKRQFDTNRTLNPGRFLGGI